MKKSIYLILLLLLNVRCEEVSDQSLEISNESLLVVEGGITNENISQEIKLSTTFKDITDEAPPVTDAIVLINDGKTNYLLSHDNSRPGTYQSSDFQALFGKVYILFIQHDGREYFAYAASEVGTSLPPINIEEVENNLFEYNYTETIPSMTMVRASWIEETTEQSKEAFFYTVDVVDITKTFAPEKEPFTFPNGATVYRKKYSITQDHQNFLRSFLSEVDWRGGAFDAAPGNVHTNMSEGAVGYFYVSMVDSDSTVIE